MCSKRREVNTEKSRALVFLEVEEGGQDRGRRSSKKVYLIRFIADLPLSWYTGSVTEYL